MSSIEDFVGREIKVIGADDPFEPSYSGVIRAADANSNSLLLEFPAPSLIGGKEYPFAVARPRKESEGTFSLIHIGRLSCSITWVSRDRFNPAQPFDLSWWRGGAAATADLVLA